LASTAQGFEIDSFYFETYEFTMGFKWPVFFLRATKMVALCLSLNLAMVAVNALSWPVDAEWVRSQISRGISDGAISSVDHPPHDSWALAGGEQFSDCCHVQMLAHLVGNRWVDSISGRFYFADATATRENDACRSLKKIADFGGKSPEEIPVYTRYWNAQNTYLNLGLMFGLSFYQLRVFLWLLSIGSVVSLGAIFFRKSRSFGSLAIPLGICGSGLFSYGGNFTHAPGLVSAVLGVCVLSSGFRARSITFLLIGFFMAVFEKIAGSMPLFVTLYPLVFVFGTLDPAPVRLRKWASGLALVFSSYLFTFAFKQIYSGWVFGFERANGESAGLLSAWTVGSGTTVFDLYHSFVRDSYRWLGFVSKAWVSIPLIVLGVAFLFFVAQVCVSRSLDEKVIRNLFWLQALLAFPAWFLLLKHHSIHHSFFTSRFQGTSIGVGVAFLLLSAFPDLKVYFSVLRSRFAQIVSSSEST